MPRPMQCWHLPTLTTAMGRRASIFPPSFDIPQLPDAAGSGHTGIQTPFFIVRWAGAVTKSIGRVRNTMLVMANTSL
jgi:hypothetical protein